MRLRIYFRSHPRPAKEMSSLNINEKRNYRYLRVLYDIFTLRLLVFSFAPSAPGTTSRTFPVDIIMMAFGPFPGERLATICPAIATALQ